MLEERELVALKCTTPLCSRDPVQPQILPPEHKESIWFSTGRERTARWACECHWTRFVPIKREGFTNAALQGVEPVKDPAPPAS